MSNKRKYGFFVESGCGFKVCYDTETGEVSRRFEFPTGVKGMWVKQLKVNDYEFDIINNLDKYHSKEIIIPKDLLKKNTYQRIKSIKNFKFVDCNLTIEQYRKKISKYRKHSIYAFSND